MNSGEQLSDDDLGLRGEARRTASALLKLAVLAGIAAGGLWAYARVEKRRTVRKQTTAEGKAAIDRLAATGGDVVSYEERYNSAIFIRRPADDEGIAALTPSRAEGDRRHRRAGHQRRPSAPRHALQGCAFGGLPSA